MTHMAAPRIRITFLGRIQRLDKVLLMTALILVVMGLWRPHILPSVFSFAWGELLDTLPFVLFSSVLVGYVQASQASFVIKRFFQTRARGSIVLAAFFGILVPFCSCSVLPLMVALMMAGVPLSVVMAFLLSAPVMDPQLFVLSFGMLGPQLTVANTLAALALGITGGSLFHVVGSLGGFKEALLTGNVTTHHQHKGHNHTHEASPFWPVWRNLGRRKIFVREFFSNLRFVGKWIVFSFILSGIVLSFWSSDTLGSWLSSLGGWTVIGAALVGIPAYVNGYAAVPFASSLLKMGVPAQAVLTFMIAGGATCVPSIVMMKSSLSKTVIATFVTIALTMSLLAGYVYGLLLK